MKWFERGGAAQFGVEIAASAGYESAIVSMDLDETQKAAVREWIGAGLGLSEIQSRLGAQFGVNLTYMEVRFLVDDLGMVPKDAEPAVAPAGASELSASSAETAAPENADSLHNAELAADVAKGEIDSEGRVSVTVDQITRAGAFASGRVTFSDGKGAVWSLDSLGRLGLSPDEPGYKPPKEEVMEFQMELQKKLSGSWS